MLALILGLESRQCIGLFGSAWLGQGLDRLSQQLPCPGSPDVSGEDKKELRVPIEGLCEPYEGLSSGLLDLARLDPADLRRRDAAPPRQRSHARPARDGVAPVVAPATGKQNCASLKADAA